jgi:hypothetical protein
MTSPLRCRIAALLAALVLVATGSAAAQAPRRHAILVGVETYAPAVAAPDPAVVPDPGVAPAPPPAPDPNIVTLRDLQTPCDDVDAISAQLQVLGWKNTGPGDPDFAQDEITELCDPSLQALKDALNAQIEERASPTDFLFIYFAGHGAQINGRNYFFGTNARLDMAKAKQRLLTYRQNQLFLTAALELAKDVFEKADRFYPGNIFLVFDTCRDDPLAFTQIQNALGVSPLTGINVSQESRGFLVLYAAAPGAVIEDGVGGSYLAQALVDDLQPSLTVDSISSNVKRDVSDRTRNNPVAQEPSRVGSLNHAEICFAGCTLFAQAAVRDSVAALRAAVPSSFAPRLRAPADTSLQDEPLPAAEPAAVAMPPAMDPELLKAQRSLYETVYQQQAPPEQEPDRVDFDVFWCEGDGEAESRTAALEFSKGLASKGISKLRDITGATVGQVRTRPLSIDENADPDLRVSGNVVRYDDTSDRESAWATMAGQISGLAGQGVRSNTPDSIDVYFCRNAAAQAAPARVWVQVAREEQRGTATLLIDAVRKDVADAWVESEVEVVETSPDDSQVRYFFGADRAIAQRVADAIAPALGAPPQVTCVKQWSHRATQGQLEVWVGKHHEVAAAMKQRAVGGVR